MPETVYISTRGAGPPLGTGSGNPRKPPETPGNPGKPSPETPGNPLVYRCHVPQIGRLLTSAIAVQRWPDAKWFTKILQNRAFSILMRAPSRDVAALPACAYRAQGSRGHIGRSPPSHAGRARTEFLSDMANVGSLVGGAKPLVRAAGNGAQHKIETPEGQTQGPYTKCGTKCGTKVDIIKNNMI